MRRKSWERNPRVRVTISFGRPHSTQRLTATRPVVTNFSRSPRKTLPETHMAVSTALGVLGKALGPMDSLAAAEKYLRESLALRIKTLPEGHWLIASSESVLGAHFIFARRFADAEALLLPAEKKLVEARGNKAPVVADARGRIVRLYEAWGKPAEAADVTLSPFPTLTSSPLSVSSGVVLFRINSRL